MLGGNILNYKLVKVKHIFVDGISYTVELLNGTSVDGIGELENGKIKVYEKNHRMENKKVNYKSYIDAVEKYYYSKEYDEVRDYTI